MTIHEIISTVRRRWWILLVCFVLGLAGAWAVVAVTPQQFQASSRVLLTTPDVDTGSLVPPGGVSASQRAVNYAQLVTGNTIPQKVIDELGLDTDVLSFTRNLQVEVPQGTTMIQIVATHADAVTARDIAQDLAEELVRTVAEVESQSDTGLPEAVATITDSAAIAARPITLGTSSLIGVGGAAGLAIGVFIVWLLEYFDRSIRGPRELAEILRAPVVTAPTGDRPTDGSARSAAIQMLQSVLSSGRDPAASTGRVVAISGIDTASPTVDLAVSVATDAAVQGHRTVLVDADLVTGPIGDTDALGSDRPGLADLVAGQGPGPEPVSAVQHWAAAGTDVILAGAGDAPDLTRVSHAALARVVAALRADYDLTVINLPTIVGNAYTSYVAGLADSAVLVGRMGRTTAEDATAGVEQLHLAGAGLAAGILLSDNRRHSPSMLTRATAAQDGPSRTGRPTPASP